MYNKVIAIALLAVCVSAVPEAKPVCPCDPCVVQRCHTFPIHSSVGIKTTHRIIPSNTCGPYAGYGPYGAGLGYGLGLGYGDGSLAAPVVGGVLGGPVVGAGLGLGYGLDLGLGGLYGGAIGAINGGNIGPLGAIQGGYYGPHYGGACGY